MMAKKDRLPGWCPSGFAPTYESEGSGCSGRVDMEIVVSEDSSAPMRKCSNLNYPVQDGFGVPIQALPLSKMSSSQRRDLVVRFSAELERIRILQKRVEMQRTDVVRVSSSSDILSCSNGQTGPSVENFKKSAGLTSGSGKKADPPNPKKPGWNRSASGKFGSASQAPAPPSASNAILMKQCEGLLKKLMQHQHGWVFNTPVDVVKFNIPDYYTVIKNPMDLGTIKSKMASIEYSSPLDFAADIRLTFSNAMTYNQPGNDVHFMADTLSKFFEVRWKVIEKKLPKVSQPSLEKSGLHVEKETIKPLPPSKRRKIDSMPHKVMPHPVKQTMTEEEKHKLSKELEASLVELPDNIVEFLKEQFSNGTDTGEDEIEIDIDNLSDDSLSTLRKLLDDYLQEKQKNKTTAEPCEIELLNDSGPSNSSMQLCKGSDPVDDEVDIGGNEPPVSSYPPVEEKKDAGCRSNAGISSGRSSGNSDLDSGSSSESESDGAKTSTLAEQPKGNSGPGEHLDGKTESVSGLDQLEQIFQKPDSVESDCHHDGESALNERQLSPDKLYRAALLRNRFADTILKAREKTLNEGEKGDPEKLRREREQLELQKRKEKARLQAEAKAAEDARRQAEAKAEAEAKQKRELQREAARQALQKMEKTIEINENSRFLEDLEMLSAVPPEHLPSSVDETSPDHSQDGLGSFKFGGSNPLEQLGLYMKMDEEEEEGEPPSVPNIVDDVEEGEI